MVSQVMQECRFSTTMNFKYSTRKKNTSKAQKRPAKSLKNKAFCLSSESQIQVQERSSNQDFRMPLVLLRNQVIRTRARWPIPNAAFFHPPFTLNIDGYRFDSCLSIWGQRFNCLHQELHEPLQLCNQSQNLLNAA